MNVLINKTEINLNLSKPFKIIELSDTHAISPNEDINIRKTKEEQWLKNRIYFANKFHEDYDSSNNIETYKCLDYLIDYINNIDCDLVLLNGDIIDFNSLENDKLLSESLNRIKHDYLFIKGNHDKDSIYPDISIKEYNEFIIFGVNNSTKSFSNESLKALKSLLEKNKPIILCCHIPINSHNDCFSDIKDYYYIDYYNSDDVSKEFIDIVLNNDLIKLVLSAHIHGHMNTKLNDKTQFITSSSGLIGSFNEIVIK